MTGKDPKNDLISFQWDFYERAVKNYSVIMRLLDSADKEEDLFEDIPRLFVEHTSFNTCKAFLREGRSVKESSFTIDGSVIDLNIEQVEKMNAGALSPGLSNHVSALAPSLCTRSRETGQYPGFSFSGIDSRWNSTRDLVGSLKCSVISAIDRFFPVRRFQRPMARSMR